MNKVVEELKKVGVFYIATIEGDKPKVRPFSSVCDIDGNVYICSGKHKDIYKQIKENPNIELCGMYDQGSWLRVSATCEEDNGIKIQEEFLKDETSPSQLYKASDGRFVTFKLNNVKALKFNFYSAPSEIKEH